MGVLGKYLWFESSGDCHHLCVRDDWADVVKSSPAQNITQAMRRLPVESDKSSSVRLPGRCKRFKSDGS